ncbi:MAG TPA: hypothetical protein VKO86_01715 [Gemmatimonadales bacterium]|nr:hypothetical protein [Gemmatimonadales bacterium]
MAFDLGIERGSTEDAVLRVEADGRPRGEFAVAAGRPPQRIVLAVGGATRLRLAVAGGRGRVVLGNPRVYPER